MAGLLTGLSPVLPKILIDRLLITESQTENLPLLSNDTIFGAYKLRRLWT